MKHWLHSHGVLHWSSLQLIIDRRLPLRYRMVVAWMRSRGGAPKSTETETLVPLASKHTDSVPAAPIAPADVTFVQREHKR
jgi:hypothetical protein